jgi:peptidoglycan/xylan/chitin deacetylase (PgdA/CDA1 family)
LKRFLSRTVPALPRRALGAELDRWQRLGRSPTLWWRDDDATAASPALDRLLALAEQLGAPLTLAVIPSDTAGDLGVLRQRHGALVTFAQHGCRHVNCMQPGLPAAEFPPTADPAQLTGSVESARAALGERLGEPVHLFVPPWNALPDNLLAALARTGHRAVSAYGATRGDAHGVARLDTHIDLLRWKPSVRPKPLGSLFEQLRHQLQRRRLAGAFAEPVGLLTHHRDHDDAAWRTLRSFLAVVIGEHGMRMGSFFGLNPLPD